MVKAMPNHEEEAREAASVRENAALEEMKREVVPLRRSIEMSLPVMRDAPIAQPERMAGGRGWKQLRGGQYRQRQRQGKEPKQARRIFLFLAPV